jgi:hypothetical protein
MLAVVTCRSSSAMDAEELRPRKPLLKDLPADQALSARRVPSRRRSKNGNLAGEQAGHYPASALPVIGAIPP